MEAVMLSANSMRSVEALSAYGAAEQVDQVQVDTRYCPIWLGTEGLHKVVRPIDGIALHQHDGKHELVGLVEPVHHLVASDGDGVCTLAAALHLYMAHRSSGTT